MTSWYPSGRGRVTHVITHRWEPCVEGLFADTLCGQNIRLVDVPRTQDEQSCWNCLRMLTKSEAEVRSGPCAKSINDSSVPSSGTSSRTLRVTRGPPKD